MLKPAASDIIGKDQSRYSLVIATAKRARAIAEDAELHGEILIEKPVKIAVNELADGKYKMIEHNQQ